MASSIGLIAVIRQALVDGGSDDLEREEEFVLARARLESSDSVSRIVERLQLGESPYQIFGCYTIPGCDTVVHIWPKIMPPGCATAPMIEAVRDVMATRGRIVADLGSGSGVLGISALIGSKDRYGIFIDIDDLACACTHDNLDRLGLLHRAEVVHADVRVATDHLSRADVVIANLPYVPSAEVATLPKRFTTYASVTAVDGGESGVDLIADILARCQYPASSCTAIVLQVGAGQEPAVLQHLYPAWQTSVRFCGPASIVVAWQ